jgi:hypothetical protein
MLASPNASMKKSGWALVDRRDRSVDPVRRLVGVAGDLVVDEDGVVVRRDAIGISIRTDDVLHVVDFAQAALDVGDDCPELGIVRCERLALDQDLLVGLLREGVVDGLVGPAGLTDT